MREYKILIAVVIGSTLGQCTKDIPWVQAYGLWIPPLLFIFLVIWYVFGKIRRYRNRTFIATRFDRWGQIITMVIGLVIFGLMYNYEFIRYFGLGLFPFIGVIAVIAGVFYEKSIQIETKGGQLLIEYRGKSEVRLDKLDEFRLHENTLEINSEDRIIVIHDIKRNTLNDQKLTEALEDYKTSKL